MNTFVDVTTDHGTYPVNRNWLRIGEVIRLRERARRAAHSQAQRDKRAAANPVRQPLTISEYRDLMSRDQAA